MAKARDKTPADEGREQAIEDLARDVYLASLGSSAGRTLESIASDAFARAEAFYAVAARRISSNTGQPEKG